MKKSDIELFGERCSNCDAHPINIYPTYSEMVVIKNAFEYARNYMCNICGQPYSTYSIDNHKRRYKGDWIGGE